MSVKKTKNKAFLKWTRAESCFKKDNIVATDWHERLERLPVFVPSYAKTRPDMGYIMSMEYGRIWQKEKDEWFSQIFQAQPKQKDILDRRKKLRKEFLEAKRQAEIKIKERKERIAREKEAKAKAEAEALEKAKRMKAKLDKCAIKKKPPKKKVEQPPPPPKPEPDATKHSDTCPAGWRQVELVLQCECAARKAQEEQAAEEQKAKEQPKAPEESKPEEPETAKEEPKPAREEPPKTVVREQTRIVREEPGTAQDGKVCPRSGLQDQRPREETRREDPVCKGLGIGRKGDGEDTDTTKMVQTQVAQMKSEIVQTQFPPAMKSEIVQTQNAQREEMVQTDVPKISQMVQTPCSHECMNAQIGQVVDEMTRSRQSNQAQTDEPQS